MTLGADLYQGRHRTQYDGGVMASQNCTPTSLAMAADQATSGAINRTGSQVRTLVKVSEETNPLTPGWSMADADLAAARLGIMLTPAASAWTTLVTLRAQGRGILLQGDSDVFPDGCSGAFDGNHCLYLPPLDHSDGRWRKGDPICREWAWEEPWRLRDYAGKFAGSGRASYAYTALIPKLLPDTGTGDDMIVTIDRYPEPRGASGTNVTGYLPDGTTRTEATWSGLVSGTASVQRSDNKAPQGSGFVVGASRPFTNYLIPAAQLTINPAPPPDCSGPVAAEHERTKAAAIAAVEAI